MYLGVPVDVVSLLIMTLQFIGGISMEKVFDMVVNGACWSVQMPARILGY